MFILVYLRPGNGLSNATLNRYCGLACKLAQLAEAQSIGIQQLLNNAQLLVEFALAFPNQAMNLASLLKLLKWLGPDRAGFRVVPDEFVVEIRKIARKLSSQTLQTPPLPTRIYSHVLSILAAEITDFEEVSDRLMALVTACVEDRLFARTRSQQNRMKSFGKPDRPEFREVLEEYRLTELWASKGYKPVFQSLSRALGEIMGCCYLQIQAFTGMRYNEVHALPHLCLEEVTANGELHYIVKGRVTKLTGGKIKRVQWVTSESGRRAIALAQRLSRTIYALAGEVPKESTTRINSHHLFVSTGYCLPSHAGRRNKPPSLDLSIETFFRLRSRLEVNITEDDLQELELIDPKRSWRTEKEFQVGAPWRFTTHQLRRSLALYAHGSGLVSLPSLKRQLQHITREMSLYYARGSQFAKDFISREEDEYPHFGEEWQEAAPEAEYLGHTLNVEMGNPDEMAGAYALWFDRNVRAKQMSLDRDATLREFRQGKRGYRETFAGGCVKVGPCTIQLRDPMNLECLLNDCKNQVIKLPKFERMIRIQRQTVKELESESSELPETRIEKDVLAMMEKRMEQIRQAKAANADSAPKAE